MNPFFNKYYGVESKNRGPFLAFSQDWFSRWQHWLLFLLNAPVLRLWSRWVLRIHRDCRYSDPIIEIQPDNYKVLLKNGQIRGDFRTHPKFSKRLYFAFRWWWWMLHYLDEAFEPTWMPKFSCGFDTLTAYPDPDPETNTVDGYTRIGNGSTEYTYSNLRSGSGTTASSNNTAMFVAYTYSGMNTNYFWYLARGIFLFSTNIGDSVTISNIILSLYTYSISTNLGDTNLHIVSSNPSSNTNIGTGDHTSLGTTSFGYRAISGLGSSAYSEFTLNSSGISAINKTGVSKFGSRDEWDLYNSFTGSWISLVLTGVQIRTADYTGTSIDPKLVITYSTSQIKSVSGVAKASVKTATGVAIASVKSILGLP